MPGGICTLLAGKGGNDMGFKMHKRLRLGPVVLNFTQRGISSWGIKIGRWSWNARTRQHTVDTPGPGYWQSRRRNRH